MRYVLVEIEARGCDFRAGEILVIVREQAERLGLRYTADSAGLAFLLPDASADGKDWCAGMTLTAVETSADQAPGPRLKLEVRVQRAALSKRDTRTLWSAVELLGYVWCAVEAGVRGRSHVAG